MKFSFYLAFLRSFHPSVIHSFPEEFYDKHTEFCVGCICFLSYCHVTYRMVLPFAMCVRNSTESVCFVLAVLKNVWPCCKGYYLVKADRTTREFQRHFGKMIFDAISFGMKTARNYIGWSNIGLLLWNMVHDHGNCANCLLSVQYSEHFKTIQYNGTFSRFVHSICGKVFNLYSFCSYKINNEIHYFENMFVYVCIMYMLSKTHRHTEMLSEYYSATAAHQTVRNNHRMDEKAQKTFGKWHRETDRAREREIVCSIVLKQFQMTNIICMYSQYIYGRCSVAVV